MLTQTYDDIYVGVLQHTEDPGVMIRQAMDLTMKKRIDFDNMESVSLPALKALIKAQHTSLLEHVVFTFVIEGVSRSLLAQITRHRMGAFTSASQHYADYRDMPMVVAESMLNSPQAAEALSNSINMYTILTDVYGVPKEEARQVLPNAAAVNLLWTVNARSLLNFFQSRLCRRNVEEMQVLASKIYDAVEFYWPEFAKCCGPYCYPTGQCNQGKMTCGRPYKPEGDK